MVVQVRNTPRRERALAHKMAPVETGEGHGFWTEMVAVKDLLTGHEGGRTYARRIDDDWVDELAAKWDDNKLDVLHVSFTDDTSRPLVVICGNHRLLGARKAKGPNYRFLCVIYAGLTLEEEALKFHAIDQDRKRHSVGDGYRAALVFNDPRTHAIDGILHKHGMSASDYSQAVQKIGEVRAVGALYRAYDYAQPDTALLDRSVAMLIRAWGQNSGPNLQPTVNGYTIEAMVGFLWRYEDLPQFDANKLVRAMQRQEQKPFALRDFHNALAKLRVEYQKAYGKSGNANLRFGMEVLARLYNRKREAAFRLPYRWVKLSRTLVRSEKGAYLAAGLTGDTPDNDL